MIVAMRNPFACGISVTSFVAEHPVPFATPEPKGAMSIVPTLATPWLAWPARDGHDIRRRAVDAHEPIIAVLLRDLEARRQKQQLELGREIDVAREVGDEALASAP
jgi:hypothetical protein